MLLDLIIAAAVFFLGRIQFKYRAVKVAGASALVSTVALVPVFVALSVLFVTLFKAVAILIALAILALAKWKVFVTVKLGYILAAIGGGLLGIFSGPLGWIALALVVLFTFAYMVEFVKSAFTKVYEWILTRSAAVMFWVRSLSDQAANGPLGRVGALFVIPLELAAVTALPIWSLFELWNLVSGEVDILYSPAQANLRLLVALIFIILLYVDYRRATSQREPVYPDLPDVLDVDGPAL